MGAGQDGSKQKAWYLEYKALGKLWLGTEGVQGADAKSQKIKIQGEGGGCHVRMALRE